MSEKPEINTVICWLEGLAEDDWADFHSDSEVQNIAKAALELLKEQQEIVRCEDCQFHYAGENEVDAWDRCRLHSINTEPDDYCSWAVK